MGVKARVRVYEWWTYWSATTTPRHSTVRIQVQGAHAQAGVHARGCVGVPPTCDKDELAGERVSPAQPAAVGQEVHEQRGEEQKDAA